MEIPGNIPYMRSLGRKNISLTTDSSNNVYLLWAYEDMPGPGDTHTGIYFASCPSGVSNWNVYGKIDELPVPGISVYNPSLAVDTSGNVYAAWEQYNSGENLRHIYFS